RRGDVPPALRDVESVLAAPTTRVLKGNERVTVAVVAADGDALVLKRFRDDGPLRLVQVLALGSSAERVWHAAALMQAAGFAVPTPVAVLEDRRLGIAVRSCAVSRWVDGAP